MSPRDGSGRPGPGPDPELEGKAALVTGASRGIGREVSIALSGLGCRVGLVARSGGPLRELATRTGGWALPCDVSVEAEVDRMLGAFRERAGGPPDLVVTAAGTFSLAPADSFSAEALDRALAVNLRGTLLVVRAVLPELKRAGRGTLVLVGSVAGRRALPGNAVYSASKFGVRGFHEVLLGELRGTGVRATLLEPAATDTPLWDGSDPDRDPTLPDRSAMLEPRDVAAAVAWLATRPPRVQVPYLPIEAT